MECNLQKKKNIRLAKNVNFGLLWSSDKKKTTFVYFPSLFFKLRYCKRKLNHTAGTCSFDMVRDKNSSLE